MNNSEIENEYKLFAPLCEQFAGEIARQLREVLSQDVKISSEFNLQSRVKSLNSIFQEIENKPSGIKSIKELDDLIGLRIVLVFKREVEMVCQLIRETFNVISQKNAQAKLGEREFGYSSMHFIVEPPLGWQTMPTFKKARGFRAEIQVRSGAQHIWASASHILQYKQERDVPPPVRRAISRVAALLETVDLEFERVLVDRTSYGKQMETNSSLEEFNVDLLAKTLDKNLPLKNKANQELYSLLLKDLIRLSVNTPKKLVELLAKNRKKMNKRERRLVAASKEMMARQIKKYGEPRNFSEELQGRLKRSAYLSHVGLVRTALELEFGKQNWN